MDSIILSHNYKYNVYRQTVRYKLFIILTNTNILNLNSTYDELVNLFNVHNFSPQIY